ncbi:MAG TPA: gamma-glutamyltransferase [Kiloniellales bacterium]|nr:gamma-glutamyltransferase [Kiloniellales bacterium]
MFCGLIVAACAEPEVGEIAVVEGFAGVVAADEPRATLIGREVLGNGGNAIDAAVAMYFAMAVTMPSRVSLGGGGVCVVFSPEGDSPRGEAIEFLPRAAPSGGMVPSGMRAMAVLHARYGRLRWAQVLAPAEALARFGVAVSRAFVQDLQAAHGLIEADPELRRIFSTADGRLADVGDRIVQPELSGVLSGIRQKGAAYLHSGPFTRRLAEASSAVGLPLTAEDVRANLPRVTDAIALPVGRDVAFFAPPRATGGLVAAQIFGMLTGPRSYDGAGSEERPHLFVEAAERAYADRAVWMQPDGTSRVPVADLVADERLERLIADYDSARHKPAESFSPRPPEIMTRAYSAGFVAGDRRSNAVACSFTMNRLFGAGRMARGTGILLAAPPRSQNDGSTSLNAVVVANTNVDRVRFAGTAGDGPAGSTALARVMLDSLIGGRALDEAVAAPRLHHGGWPDVVLTETGIGQGVRDALQARGHRLQPVPAIGRVNAFHCADGLGSGGDCRAVHDPRGFGLAYRAQ